jgi:hypothetical protein
MGKIDEKTGGRKKGTPNKATQSIKDLLLSILEDYVPTVLLGRCTCHVKLSTEPDTEGWSA